MDIHPILNWLQSQNYVVLAFAAGGVLNIIVAGAKVMGWMKLAEFCGKLEDALTAMVQAAFNKNKNVIPNTEVKPNVADNSGGFKSTGN